MTFATSSLSASLVRAACLVAAGEPPARGLAAVLDACRECLGASGAALLQERAGQLVPLASDGLTLAERPLDTRATAHYPLRVEDHVEGVLLLAGTTPGQRGDGGPMLAPLLELAAAAVRNVRLAEERANAIAALTGRVEDLERRAMEHALGRELAASEERFRTLYQSAACGILVRDANGVTTDANEAATRIVGVPLAEMRGHTWSRAMGGATREDGTPFPEDDRPLAVVLRERRPVHGVTMSLYRPDGERRWLQVDAVPVFDADGALSQVVTSFIDVTERKLAEDAAERERQEKSALLDSAAEGIMGVDARGRCTFINRTGAAMLGYDPAELQGRHLHPLMHHSHADGTPYPADDCPLRRAFTTRESLHVDDEVLWRRDGTSFPAEYTAAPVWEDGRITSVVVSFSDITARKEAEQRLQALTQSEKLRALGQMAGGVAHDLNQYLGLVAGHGELALRAVDQGAAGREGLIDSLNIIVQAAMDGAETVKRLLAFGRSRPEGPPVRLDVGELLREVAKLTAPSWRDAAQAQGRPISLHVEVERDLAVNGWPESLREACTNLVLNAVDALPNGGAIRLVGRRKGARVVVEVIDTGVGMTPEVRARLFEPFFSTKGERGTGLGLPMVFGIVERHGGEIAVESAPGQGATFRLLLPAATPTASAAPAPAAPGGARPLRVLAVDDEPALGRMAALMLAPDGHNVVVATSGEEALERLAAESFDLVISDVGMGAGMNGWELAEQVRTHYPGVRFALATGWGAQIDPEEARALGICAVLPKPYHLADMRRLVSAS